MAGTETLDAQAVRRQRELKRHLIGAVALAAGALLTGVLLVPHGDELLLIHVRNRDIARARALLSDARGQGVSSAASVVAHDELYLLEGHVDDALTETERYVEAHPHDVEAWTRLARMYGDAQRLYDQRRATEEIYRLEPTAAVARRLATLHRWTGDEPAEAAVLRDLVSSGQASTDESLRAARLEASLDHPALARDLLEATRQKDPASFDYAAMELYASVWLALDGQTRLAGRVGSLPIARTQPETLGQLARAMISWGRPDAAVALFDMPPGADVPAERLTMRAQAATGTSEAHRVAEELAVVDAERPLAPTALTAFVQLALSVGDYRLVETVLGSRAHTGAQTLVGLAIGHAVAHGNRQAAQALVARVGDAGLRESPLLALELAVERGDGTGARAWIDRIDGAGDATPDQRAAVAQFEARLGLRDRAFDRLVSLVAGGQAPAWAAGDLAGLAQVTGRVDDGLRALEPAAAIRAPGARSAWAKLAIASGRSDLVATWITDSPDLRAEVPSLTETYYLLAAQEETALAATAASRLFEADRSDDHALLLGQALLAAGRPVDALGPLTLASARRADARDTCDVALMAALRSGAPVADALRRQFTGRLTDPRVSDEHRAFLIDGLWAAGVRGALLQDILPLAARDIDRWLQPLVESARDAGESGSAIAVIGAALAHTAAPSARAGLDTSRHTALVQALMTLDAPDDLLLPHLRQMAYSAGGTWVFAYDERLAARALQADRVALWTAVSRASDASTDDRRGAAARLVELGATPEAIDIFRELAATEGPDGPDVQQLLYLWGPRPTDAQRDWLIARLQHAPPDEQPGWIARLIDAGGASHVVRTMPTLPAGAAPPLATAWLDAYRLGADGSGLRLAIEQILERIGASTDLLRQTGRAALAANLHDLAGRAFAAIAERNPQDLESQRWLGTLAFYEGAHGRARAWLSAYADHGGAAPEALYQLGELSRQAHDEDRARVYFQRARELLDGTLTTASDRTLLANILVRLEDRPLATVVFESVLREQPALDHTRADYAAALLEWGDYGRAWTVLNIDDRPPEGPVPVGRQSAGSQTLEPQPETPRPETSQPDDGGRKRLDLLRLQWLNYKGRYADAQHVVDRLSSRYPSDPDVLLARARADAERGRTADADRAIEQARLAAPAREDIAQLLQAQARARAPLASLSSETRSVGDAWTEQSTRVAVDGHLRLHAPITLSLERLGLTAPRVRRADGNFSPIDTELDRAEASVTAPIAPGATLGGTIFGTRHGAGAGLSFSLDDLRGRSSVTAEVGRPFWEFLETAANDGRRDRVSLERQWRLRADTAAWAVAAWNRYRVADAPGVTSAALTLGVVRTIRRTAPAITLQYGLDRETRLQAALDPLASGPTALSIPLSNREVHLMGAIGRFGVAGIWDAEASGGYTIDRLGGRGSFLTAKMTPRAQARAGIELWADRRLYSIVTSQRVLRAGARVVVRVP